MRCLARPVSPGGTFLTNPEDDPAQQATLNDPRVRPPPDRAARSLVTFLASSARRTTDVPIRRLWWKGDMTDVSPAQIPYDAVGSAETRKRRPCDPRP